MQVAKSQKPENNKLQIRNSTVDFLVFTRDAGEDGIEVRVQDGDVWLTQKAIGQLFDVERSVVTKHLKNVFASGELSQDSVCAKFAHTADDGKTYPDRKDQARFQTDRSQSQSRAVRIQGWRVAPRGLRTGGG